MGSTVKAILLAAVLLVISALAGFTTPEYAERSGESCAFCHAGANGGPLKIKNKVYDVSDSPKWQGGAHFRAHAAGQDLTQKIAAAPHGEEVFERFPVVAELSGAPRALPGGGDRPRGAGPGWGLR